MIQAQDYQSLPIIKQLDISAFPLGKISHAWVHVVSSGMGQPILVPLIIARGARGEGPILGITAAVHGNELNGLRVIQKVFQMVQIEALKGTLIGVPIVNVPGFLNVQRRFTDGVDLNRIMPGKVDGNVSEIYAYRIIKKIVSKFEYLLDVHTASAGRINSYYIRADMNASFPARMANLQNADIIVNNEGHDGTLRSAVADLGIQAITVEAGDPYRFQKGMIRSAITGALNCMRELDMIDEEIVQPDSPAILCKRSYWLYTNVGGVLEVLPAITDWVAEGERIALVRNIFGDIIKEYFAPEQGIVVGKSVNPVSQTGARILHLGIQ